MLTEQEVLERLRAAVQAQGGQSKFAEAHGFTLAYVHDVFHGRRALADRILAAIGVNRVTSYRLIDSQIDSRGESKSPGADAPKAS